MPTIRKKARARRARNREKGETFYSAKQAVARKIRTRESRTVQKKRASSFTAELKPPCISNCGRLSYNKEGTLENFGRGHSFRCLSRQSSRVKETTKQAEGEKIFSGKTLVEESPLCELNLAARLSGDGGENSGEGYA